MSETVVFINFIQKNNVLGRSCYLEARFRFSDDCAEICLIHFCFNSSKKRKRRIGLEGASTQQMMSFIGDSDTMVHIILNNM